MMKDDASQFTLSFEQERQERKDKIRERAQNSPIPEHVCMRLQASQYLKERRRYSHTLPASQIQQDKDKASKVNEQKVQNRPGSLLNGWLHEV